MARAEDELSWMFAKYESSEQKDGVEVEENGVQAIRKGTAGLTLRFAHGRGSGRDLYSMPLPIATR